VIISMTGYGQGEASNGTSNVMVEIRTVNHRFLDYSIKLPRSLHSRERDIKERVKQKLARGRVYITVSLESELADRGATINEALLERYLEQLREFGKKHGLAADVDVNTLAQLPDAIGAQDEEPETEAVWPLVEKGLEAAITACHKMRAEEGRALEKDLKDRMKSVDGIVEQIEAIAPDVSKRHAEAFRRRVDQLLDDVKIDPDRMTTEIALLAERLDFTEEVTRLRSHLAQFNKYLGEGGEVSKKLTYILQEMHREASTIGAKASDSDVIQQVVQLKEETEKIREQLQNVE
jgi:uncharacterized protein (TIGR00255 family)